MKISKQINILISLLFFILYANTSFGIEYDDIQAPKDCEYRVGTSDNVELPYKFTQASQYEEKQTNEKREYVQNKTYADSSLKEISSEISGVIDSERDEIVEDVAILWAGAASKSETVKFTIYKLSNPDADKPDESVVKKVLRPLIGFSGMASAGFMNPIAATSAIMGGQLFNSLSTSDKELNYKYTKVTDADMILLLRRIDELQQKLINQYINYITALKSLKRIDEILENRAKLVNQSYKYSEAIILICDNNYRSILEKKRSAEINFMSERAALEQLVGIDALEEFETNLKKRNSQN